MRRHSSLAVTSAIVLLGGAGVFGGGAISLRTSTVTGHLKAVRAFQHALRTRQAGEAPVGPSSPLLDDLAATTPSPYLFATEPLRLPRVATVRRLGIGTEPAATAAQWHALRDCESGDRYDEDTGNGYYGAYQFAPTTWWELGYDGLPSEAPPVVQNRAAVRLQRIAGWSAWPVCSEVVGL